MNTDIEREKCPICRSFIDVHTEGHAQGWRTCEACDARWNANTLESGIKRFDVRASCYQMNGDGSDGAYDLLLDNATAQEIGDKLVEVLADFGLANCEGPFRLQINIGDAGQGDNLPL